ncbi:hypothetical protein BJ508DRAFT_159195 [Ascobolus immersus RN42]|uniref:Uncharacterized protein n=1 Tax=Ascobolus immersus RN42 TaxID=1160509 RepID=A0A3N4IIQ5_ASCIM|nr:hypothetical protein BJ508DRAFT_159195 [Ascobolus immersus RN42]
MMALNQPVTISALVNNCAGLLTKAKDMTTLEARMQTELADLHYRFRVWSGNVGALATGLASIDHRLRDDKNIADAVVFALARLSRSLSDIINPPLLEDSEDEEAEFGTNTEEVAKSETRREGSDEIASDEDSDSTLSFGTSEDEEPDILEDYDKPSTAQLLQTHPGNELLIAKARIMVDRLYKLASVLRKPASTTENTKECGVPDQPTRHQSSRQLPGPRSSYSTA